MNIVPQWKCYGDIPQVKLQLKKGGIKEKVEFWEEVKNNL